MNLMMKKQPALLGGLARSTEPLGVTGSEEEVRWAGLYAAGVSELCRPVRKLFQLFPRLGNAFPACRVAV